MDISHFYLDLLHGLLDGKDLPYFVRRLVKQINKPVLIADSLGRVLASHDPLRALFKSVDTFPLMPFDKHKTTDIILTKEISLVKMSWQLEEICLEGYQFPLVAHGRLWGYCFITAECAPSNEERRYLWEAALVFLLALKSLSTYREEQEQYQTEFVRDILYNNYDSTGAIRAKAQLWNWDLSGAWALVVIQIAEEKLKLAKDIAPLPLINKRRPIYTILNKQLLIFVPLLGNEKKKNKEFMNAFLAKFMIAVRKQGLEKLEIGVGSFADSVDYLYKVYQEAKIAVELGRVFSLEYPCYFDEMGLLKFIFTQPAYELQEFSQLILGDLITYDRENETDLIHTLISYFESRIQILECARSLYIHENTLRNRLKKIEQLTGLDLRRVDHLVNIFVALQIIKL